eukprot:scaffold649923_cov51-Prasinocladus_malaysianus.AAC.1
MALAAVGARREVVPITHVPVRRVDWRAVTNRVVLQGCRQRSPCSLFSRQQDAYGMPRSEYECPYI